MSMHGRDPWSDVLNLREAMSSVFEEAFTRPRAEGYRAANALPIDVYETPERYEILASVPGLSADDVEITVLGDTVRIRAGREDNDRASSDAEGSRWLLRERYSGSAERTVALPGAVTIDDVTAEFRDGVLTIVLPKAEQSRARTIQVRSGESSTATPIDVEAERANGE